jgi:hypothetical protein
MTAATGRDISEEQFMQIVSAVCASDASLTGVGAALIAANQLQIAKDSRSFSNKFGIAHALVLREISGISGEDGLLAVLSRNERTHRTEFALTEKGKRLAATACP